MYDTGAISEPAEGAQQRIPARQQIPEKRASILGGPLSREEATTPKVFEASCLSMGTIPEDLHRRALSLLQS